MEIPSIAANDQFAGKGVGGNLTSATTTLYKSVMTESGFQSGRRAETSGGKIH